MTKEEQQAREMAERCAHGVLNELKLFSYLPPDIGAEAIVYARSVILRELNLVALLADKARLDWLERQEGVVTSGFEFKWFEEDKDSSLRTAITNAMKQEEGK